MLVTILTSVAGGLLLAGIVALFKSRWLFLVVPKLFFPSALSKPSAKGNVVQLTLVNAGFRSEEDVKVVFRNTASLELLASSKSSIAFSGLVLTVPRISRFEAVNVMFHVEGKVLDKDDIESVESKETTGKVVEKRQQVSTPVQHLVMWPLILLILFIPFAFGTYIGKDTKQSAFDYILGQFDSVFPPYPIPYSVDLGSVNGYGNLQLNLKSKELAGTITKVTRRGDTVNVHVRVVNNTKELISASAEVKSSAGEGPWSFFDRRASFETLPPGEKEERVLKAFLPETDKNLIIVVEFRYDAGSSSAWHRNVVHLKQAE